MDSAIGRLALWRVDWWRSIGCVQRSAGQRIGESPTHRAAQCIVRLIVSATGSFVGSMNDSYPLTSPDRRGGGGVGGAGGGLPFYHFVAPSGVIDLANLSVFRPVFHAVFTILKNLGI